MRKINNCADCWKNVDLCELFGYILGISFIFVFIISTVIFPIIHLSKAIPLRSEFENAFNDVCDCVETANLLQLGPRRTALGKECIMKYYNPIFDDIAPINKFFGNNGYRPSKYDDRADILNNITSQYRPPNNNPNYENSDSDSDPCNGDRFRDFKLGIGFCFTSVILVLFICPVAAILWYWNDIKIYIRNKLFVDHSDSIESTNQAKNEIEMNPKLEGQT